jgi:hypothetical protein
MPLRRRPFPNSHASRTALHWPAVDGQVLRERDLCCEECRQVWLSKLERWRAYWIDDGPEEKLLFYCPECAEREFGSRLTIAPPLA